MKAPKILGPSPIPEAKAGRPSTSVYPFESMKLNESFIAGKYTRDLLNKVAGAAYHYGEKLGRKFVTRNDNGLLRVWRSA